MPLKPPVLDDRTYRQLLAETLARIPVHNPEWTNFNDSDPGVTLVQLFSFLTDSVLYRADQIPERNRQKFLALLGIGLIPAAAARGFVTIDNTRGPRLPVVFEEGLDLRAGSIRFRTTQGLQVLPVEARAYVKATLPAPLTEEGQEQQDRYRLLYSDLLETPGAKAAFYATTALAAPAAGAPLPVVDLRADTVDGCLWIALLARPKDVRTDPQERAQDLVDLRSILMGKTLTLGVMPGLPGTGVVLPAGQQDPRTDADRAIWEIARPPDGGMLPPPSQGAAGRLPRYERLSARAVVDVLREPGLVELTLPGTAPVDTWRDLEASEEGTGDFPPSLADRKEADRVLTWLRLRVPVTSGGGTPRALASWVGINATWVEQRALVAGEVVGTGSGEPHQQLTLANVPVLAGSLVLRVGDERWRRVDDLLAAPAEVPLDRRRVPLFLAPAGPDGRRLPEVPDPRVYTLDPESGVLTFGDGAHGMRPRRGARIVADYAYGGGRAGNVGIGAISSGPDLPAGFQVTNPIETWNGDDPEDVASAERTIPRVIQHRDRLVSADDFRDITMRTPGVDIGRMEVVPLYDPVADLESVPGVVTVVVIPRYDPLRPGAPEPDRLFLDAVCRHLQPRRLVTTELHVRGPRYRDVWVSLGVEVMSGRPTGPTLEAVRARIREFLSPLHGGRDGNGWPMGGTILAREIEAVVSGVAGVRLVNETLLGGALGGATGGQLDLASLELPRLIGVEVASPQAVPLEELRGLVAPDAPIAVPIPLTPEAC